MILVTQQAAELKLQHNRGELAFEHEVMLRYIISTGCRRRVLSTYLDGDDLARSCTDDPEWARCDRCGEGALAIRERTRAEEGERQLLEQSLREMTIGCVWCWLDGRHTSAPAHGTPNCVSAAAQHLGRAVEGFRQGVRFREETHSCHRCWVSQALCATRADTRAVCQWPGVMATLLLSMMAGPATFEEIQMAGYNGAFRDIRAYQRWLGERHHQRVWGENMSNAMAVAIRCVRFCRPGRSRDSEGEA
jgi:hypothetical protein